MRQTQSEPALLPPPPPALQEEEEYETKGGRRRTWDDDFVLKRQFSALVPAFDPRPGRTNVQQTTDLEIPPPGKSLRPQNVLTGATRQTNKRANGQSNPTMHMRINGGGAFRNSSLGGAGGGGVRAFPSPGPHPQGDDASSRAPEATLGLSPPLAQPLLWPQVAGLGTTREVELPLCNYKSTIFFYVQRLLQLSCNGSVKTDKLRRIWEPTYT